MTPDRKELADRLEVRARAYGQHGVEGGNDGYYSAANAADDLAAAAALRQEPSVEEVVRVILLAVFEGYEHGQCEEFWEPAWGKYIAQNAAQAILAITSKGAK